MLLLYWLFPLHGKINAATSEVNVIILEISQRIFQRELTAPPLKQTILCDTYMEEKYFTFILRRNISTNILVIDNFIKRYQNI